LLKINFDQVLAGDTAVYHLDFNLKLTDRSGCLRFAQRQIVGKLSGRQKPGITEAALAHGFDHLSRFAEHYRRLFDELPSQTLRRVQVVP
jgi:AraC-like DNA-binding protein